MTDLLRDLMDGLQTVYDPPDGFQLTLTRFRELIDDSLAEKLFGLGFICITSTRVATTNEGRQFHQLFSNEQFRDRLELRLERHVAKDEEVLSVYPCVIRPARYSGVYEGGHWTAFHGEPPEEADDDDVTCMTWWSNPTCLVGVGNSPTDAFRSLVAAVKACRHPSIAPAFYKDVRGQIPLICGLCDVVTERVHAPGAPGDSVDMCNVCQSLITYGVGVLGSKWRHVAREESSWVIKVLDHDATPTHSLEGRL